MNMKEMLEITRLLRTGGLTEATSMIQRTLKGIDTSQFKPNIPDAPLDATVIEGSFHVIDDESPSSTTAQPSTEESPHSPFGHIPAPPVLDWQKYFDKASRPARTPAPAREAEPGGKFTSGSYTNDAGTRAYKLYIPSSYHGQKMPLVVMLHGCTQDPDDFAAGTRMNVLAEEHQCLVVYPAQAKTANHGKCWHWFKAEDQVRDRGEPSLIAGITKKIISTYAVDTQRVYVAGLSAGGAMAAVMGRTYPDIYTAVGVHSGLPYGAARDMPSAFAAMQGGVTNHSSYSSNTQGAIPCEQSVPMIVFHGDKDTKVHPRNGDQVITQWIAVHASNKPHATANQKPRASVQQGQVPNGHAYSRIIYRNTSEQIILEQWRIHGAGHAWSGGSASGSYTDPKGPDATREMMRFFYDHRRP